MDGRRNCGTCFECRDKIVEVRGLRAIAAGTGVGVHGGIVPDPGFRNKPLRFELDKTGFAIVCASRPMSIALSLTCCAANRLCFASTTIWNLQSTTVHLWVLMRHMSESVRDNGIRPLSLGCSRCAFKAAQRLRMDEISCIRSVAVTLAREHHRPRHHPRPRFRPHAGSVALERLLRPLVRAG